MTGRKPGALEVVRLELSDAEKATAVARMHQLCPFRVPLFRAVLHGVVFLLECDRGSRWPARAEIRRLPDRPVIAVFGDDDARPTGPLGFPAAPAAARWAKGAIVHAAGGEAGHYAMAVDMALLRRRLLLVETNFPNAKAWCDLLGNGTRFPVTCIVPRGRIHPVARSEPAS